MLSLPVHPTRRIAALVLAMAIGITACGGGDDADQTTADTEATAGVDDGGSESPNATPAGCPLTADQVTAVLGIDMGAGNSNCAFQASDGTFAEVYYADVPVEVFAADEPTAVEGVGDKAHTGPSGELYVRAGGLAFSIHVLASPTAIDAREAQIELARLVIDGAS